MAGLKVYQLAKELNISSKELIEKLAKLGVRAKSHMSVVDGKVADKLRGDFKKATAKRVEEKPPPSEEAESRKKARPKKQIPAEQVIEKETSPEASASEEVAESALPEIEIEEGVTVKEFAQVLGKSSSEIIKRLMQLGEMTTINQPISHEAINVLAEEFGYEAKIVSPKEKLEKLKISPEDLEPRAPVVTVMGHVDHGKTLLLDAIRKTDVVSREAGGITQHIGAYQVVHDGKKITFIDTPGHEAFTAMRARGARVTDVAVLVVAADDGVMPQTVEAIDHARAANVPIVVAINKIDKPDANPDKVKKQLSEYGLSPEEWGGDTVFVSVSAKERTNLDELLDMILLVTEIQELKASRKCKAYGVAIEAKLDKGRGPVATVLIEQGTLRVGDAVVAGLSYGRVRAMIDDKGERIAEAVPGQPVEILGLSRVPEAGDEVRVVSDEKQARRIAEERALRQRLIKASARKHITLDDLYERVKEGEIQEFKLIVKADTQGSVEAIKESLGKLDQREVRINVIHTGAGAISETDVMLAAASDAIVIGFNVRPDAKAKEMAEKEKVDLRTYNVIYKVVEDIDAARRGMLKPIIEEVELGEAEVKATFKVPRVGVVAGCYVRKGKITRASQVRLVRDGTVVYQGRVSSLRRFKESVNEVAEGFECGVGLQDFQDVKEGDILEAFTTVEKPRK